MVSWLPGPELVVAVDLTTSANAGPLSLEVFAAGDTAGTVEAGHDLGFKEFSAHNLAHFLRVGFDTGAVSLHGTFPTNTFFGIATSKWDLRLWFLSLYHFLPTLSYLEPSVNPVLSEFNGPQAGAEHVERSQNIGLRDETLKSVSPPTLVISRNQKTSNT